MTRAVAIVCGIAVSLPLHGCVSQPPVFPTEAEVVEYLAGQIATWDTVSDRCSGVPVSIDLTRAIIPINAEVCLGCANVGWMIPGYS
jgi:hypothetical protein